MSYKRNRLGQCEGVEVKKICQTKMETQAVSMVLFFLVDLCICHAYTVVILLKYCQWRNLLCCG